MGMQHAHYLLHLASTEPWGASNLARLSRTLPTRHLVQYVQVVSRIGKFLMIFCAPTRPSSVLAPSSDACKVTT